MNQAGIITCVKSDRFSFHERSEGYPGAKDRNVALRLSDRASSTNFGGAPQNTGRTNMKLSILNCSFFDGSSNFNER